MSQLKTKDIIYHAFKRGRYHFMPTVVNFTLWLLTLWIPYINAGATVGLKYGLTMRMRDGTHFPMTEIFNSKYREKIGPFFLFSGFIVILKYLFFLALIIPAFVVSLSWSQSLFLILDKNVDIHKSFHASNELTYGKKRTIFFAYLILDIIFCAFLAIAYFIGRNVPIAGGLTAFTIIASAVPVYIGAMSYIYGTLTKDNHSSQSVTEKIDSNIPAQTTVKSTAKTPPKMKKKRKNKKKRK